MLCGGNNGNVCEVATDTDICEDVSNGVIPCEGTIGADHKGLEVSTAAIEVDACVVGLETHVATGSKVIIGRRCSEIHAMESN